MKTSNVSLQASSSPPHEAVIAGPFEGGAHSNPRHSCAGLRVLDGEYALRVSDGDAYNFATYAVGSAAALRAWLPTSRYARAVPYDRQDGIGGNLGSVRLLELLDAHS